MKKFFKSLSLICLALLIACPLMLAGCSKNFTINVSVEGEGMALLENVNSESVVGKNVVEKGEKFEIYIKPKTGYKIEKILIDGEEYKGYAASEHYYSFENVEDDHDIKIVFAADDVEVKLMCKSGTSYALYDTVSIKFGSFIDLDNYGGEGNKLWYKLIAGNREYAYNGQSEPDAEIADNHQSNMLVVRNVAGLTLYTDKTASELEDLLS